MDNKYKLSRHAPGTAPGTLVTPENALPSVIRVIAYNGDNLIEQAVASPEEAKTLADQWKVVWINVDGLGSKDVIERFGALFNLHSLALEDVLNPYQRPKVEEYRENSFIVTRMARIEKNALIIEQLSMFLGKNYILTFQDRPGDCLDPIRDRLRKGSGRRIRTDGADYLAYALIDAVVDSYFPVLEQYGEWIDKLEDEVIFKPIRKTIERIHHIKRKLNRLRHAIWPMREAINGFSRLHAVEEATRLYVRDCYDHLVQVMDLLEMDRERSSGLIDVYMSSISNRMNEVMKVLTIITTIFIPLSFIAGVYGMNFDYMPELHWRHGYPAVLLSMAFIAACLVYYFRRKGWIGQ